MEMESPRVKFVLNHLKAALKLTESLLNPLCFALKTFHQDGW